MRPCLILFIFLSVAANAYGQESSNLDLFSRIMDMTHQKDFFEANELFNHSGAQLSDFQKTIVEAQLSNAFNQLENSELAIDKLLKENRLELADSLQLMLLDLKLDNAYKQYEYQKAKLAAARIVEEFGEKLSPEELEDYTNSLKIWTILEQQKPQQVHLRATFQIGMKKDQAGLNTLPVHSNSDSVSMIFDTGANLSTVTQSTAKRMGLKILPDSIQVGSITGSMVYSRLAVCEKLRIGSAELENVVFLILDDSQLHFPQIDYQIQGILGFPVMQALERIRISQSGEFLVTKENTPADSFSQPSMAMDHLSLLIRLDGRPYFLDTGADQTILYSRYYQQFKQEIESRYTLEEIQFGGAGGYGGFPGFRIDFEVPINSVRVSLPETAVLKDELSEKWKFVYGNVGQDLVSQFEFMTLDFANMQFLLH